MTTTRTNLKSTATMTAAELAAQAGVTESELRHFAELIAVFAGQANGSAHRAVQLAQEDDERRISSYHENPRYRQALNATLAGTYDEFRAEAGLQPAP